MAGHEGKSLNTDVESGKMVFEPILEEGVFRFDCSADDRHAAFQSISFEHSKIGDTPIANAAFQGISSEHSKIRDTPIANAAFQGISLGHSKIRDTPIANVDKVPTYIPCFERKHDQQIVKIKFPRNTSFYGTGEVSGQLERTGTRIFTWNTDAYAYGSNTTPLYQSHPWVLAILPNGEAFGVLAYTTRRCEIDLRRKSNIKIISASPYPVITFGPRASPTDVLVSYARAVGTVFMPPKWSLGYHQCRYSYETAERVREIMSTFREKEIPCDAIWMDIDYMNEYRCFTFNQDRFPDPKSLADDLHENGFKAIWVLDPGIKKDEGYFVYDSGSERDVWVQTADGEPFVGDVWPGPCVFPDYPQSSVRSWWANLIKDFISNGVDGIWNDMNEPSVKTKTKTMPESNIHRGDLELGGRQKHSYYHNVYGMLMARSTYEGMKLANGQKRPFVLTRAGFVSSQMYAATWTGDNISTWEHLHMSIAMVLNLGLSGQPLSGPDIGGFKGNATPELFGRWMGFGAMFPFCRGHSEKKSKPHEPWSFGEECEKVCRLALRRRYRLLPHLYTLVYMAHTKGIPVATPTFFADPKDLELRTQENSFLLGPLLVYASTAQESYKMEGKLPKGIWLGFDFEDTHPDLPALYLKGGSIIPHGDPYQHTGEADPTDNLTLLVALDELGKAEGIIFEDDGDGYEYTKGGYLLTTYVAERQAYWVTVKILKTEGCWLRPNRRLHVQLLLGKGAKIDAWGIDGEDLHIPLPPEREVSDLVQESEKKMKIRLESAKRIPNLDESSGHQETKDT